MSYTGPIARFVREGVPLTYAGGHITAERPAPLPPPPAPAPGTIARTWAGLHDFVRRPVIDPAATIAAVQAWAAGLAEGRRRQAEKYIAANPIDGHDPETWANRFRNTINKRLGLPMLTVEQARRATPIYVHNSATGLGDAVSGLYAVCGLADATGRPVVYRSHSAKWLAPASHPGVRIEPIERGSLGIDLNGGEAGYARSIASAPTRTQGYCGNVAAALGIPQFNP